MSFNNILTATAFSLALTTAPALAQSAGETVLHAFSGLDGENPGSGLVLGPKGVLYGSARDGGGTACSDYFANGQITGCGTIFELTPPVVTGGPWTFQVLYAFTGGTDGAYPGTLLLGKNGELYGTTSQGGKGAVNGSGSGVLFKLVPPTGGGTTWTERVLYDFCRKPNCDDGANPGDGLLLSNGALYGTTAYGGTASVGTVFRYTLPTSTSSGQFTTLYTFQGLNDGATPFSGVISDRFGHLFGVTYAGGGTGCAPNSGCGTAYELTPVGSTGTYVENVIYRFLGVPDGSEPTGRMKLLKTGQLVGVSGGGDANSGAIFELTPPATQGQPWTEMLLTNFGIPNMTPPDAAFPNPGLTLAADGSFWGTTYGGGDPNNQLGSFYPGTIFQLQPPSQGGGQWSRNDRYSFMGGTDGVQPTFGMTAGRTNIYYGTTSHGGTLTGCPELGGVGCGTVFEFVPF